MKVQVRLFAGIRQLAGRELIELELPEHATVADVRSTLRTQFPAMTPLLAHTRFAVNNAYAVETTRLSRDSEVACIPPVSGG